MTQKALLLYIIGLADTPLEASRELEVWVGEGMKLKTPLSFLVLKEKVKKNLEV